VTGETRPGAPFGRLRWLSVVAGSLFGLAAGLLLTWEIWPVEYFDTDPVDLRAELKQDYLVLISSSYALTEDWEQMQKRFGWLGFDDETASRALAGLMKRHAELGMDVTTVRSLAKSAYALGARDSQVMVFVITPTPTVTPTPTDTVTPTATPTPTHTPLIPTLPSTPTSTPIAKDLTEHAASAATPILTATATLTPLPVYVAAEVSFSCRPVERAGKTGLLEVWVEGADGQPQGSVALSMVWDDNKDVFFTGLKSDQDVGYADFEMQPRQEYVLAVDGQQSEAATISFREEDCLGEASEQMLPVWRVVFKARKSS